MFLLTMENELPRSTAKQRLLANLRGIKPFGHLHPLNPPLGDVTNDLPPAGEGSDGGVIKELMSRYASVNSNFLLK